VTYRLVPEGDRLFRLIVFDSPSHGIALSNVEGEAAFDTSDLLQEHLEHKGYYRVVGRADDQISMANGEKVNPGPFGRLVVGNHTTLAYAFTEDIILGNPNVRGAVMFGRTRDQVGIIVEPTQPLDTFDSAQVSGYRNLIWREVEKANAIAPTYGRIFKEFILVVDVVQKPLARTPKGTIQRNAALKQYEREIDSIYQAASEPTKAEWAVPPTSWDEVSIGAFVSRVVNGVMRGEEEKPVDEDGDLFEQGCDR
jgi:acyl-CoA synthetase (AMP-forming)/AMP-acid ligase II